jgi:hypothetical protein
MMMSTDRAKKAVELLRSLTEDEREEVLESFCRACHVPIDEPDWSGRNYCLSCSPDPRD